MTNHWTNNYGRFSEYCLAGFLFDVYSIIYLIVIESS